MIELKNPNFDMISDTNYGPYKLDFNLTDGTHST